MTQRLRRHDLVWLSLEGWRHLQDESHDKDVQGCLQHWCTERLPLVVTRQEPGCSELALGLAAPIAWRRRKIPLRVPRACVLYNGRFPPPAKIAPLFPSTLRAAWSALAHSVAQEGADVRVHGSHGWQQITGLRYLMPTSDLDLLVLVSGMLNADRIAAQLEAFAWKGPRLDGELLFSNGNAVAWREWAAWRRGAVDRILVKRPDGVTLEEGHEWLQERQP